MAKYKFPPELEIKKKIRYYLVSNLTWVSKEILVEIEGKWEHFLLPSRGSIRLPWNHKRSTSLTELEKRNQVLIKEVIE